MGVLGSSLCAAELQLSVVLCAAGAHFTGTVNCAPAVLYHYPMPRGLCGGGGRWVVLVLVLVVVVEMGEACISHQHSIGGWGRGLKARPVASPMSAVPSPSPSSSPTVRCAMLCYCAALPDCHGSRTGGDYE